MRIARLGEAEGFLTGYYEPIVEGSRFPNPEFHVPLYRRPRDLVAAGHKPGAERLPQQGRAGRPPQRQERDRALSRPRRHRGRRARRPASSKSAGSRIRSRRSRSRSRARRACILEDGTPLRVNYDAHNGHPYTAVGRVLIERNHIPREEMSMQRIRRMDGGQSRSKRARCAHTNRSFVFFRITGLSNEDEPAGAQGVPLTPLRSIAVDKIHVYGTPFFIEASLPIDSAQPTTPFRRLMIAQDTGSAIVGPARADLYWGAGDDAGRIAGRIRHAGRFVMLVPRELDMVAAGKHMPLPLPKPAIPEDDGKKDEAKKDDVKRTKSRRQGQAGRRPSPKTKAKRPKKSRRQAGPDRSQAAIMSADDGKPRRRKLERRGARRSGAGSRARSRRCAEGRCLADPADGSRRRNARQAETRAVARPHAAVRASATPKPAPRLAPLDRRQKQRLARGTEAIDARIDLHGRTQGEAHAALLRFLRSAQADGAKFVLVITGKGARATRACGASAACSSARCRCGCGCPNSAAYVVGFEEAHVGHGGEGALYVRVRRARGRADVRHSSHGCSTMRPTRSLPFSSMACASATLASGSTAWIGMVRRPLLEQLGDDALIVAGGAAMPRTLSSLLTMSTTRNGSSFSSPPTGQSVPPSRSASMQSRIRLGRAGIFDRGIDAFAAGEYRG